MNENPVNEYPLGQCAGPLAPVERVQFETADGLKTVTREQYEASAGPLTPVEIACDVCDLRKPSITIRDNGGDPHLTVCQDCLAHLADVLRRSIICGCEPTERT
jgi:hypothetical protein